MWVGELVELSVVDWVASRADSSAVRKVQRQVIVKVE
jgi:hypothetical protein